MPTARDAMAETTTAATCQVNMSTNAIADVMFEGCADETIHWPATIRGTMAAMPTHIVRVAVEGIAIARVNSVLVVASRLTNMAGEVSRPSRVIPSPYSIAIKAKHAT
jgi:hypothetical protein